MTESYVDYDLEHSIRQVAARLEIAGCSHNSGRSIQELFSDIENYCPEAANILLEQTFEKDKLKNYLASRPPFPTINGYIDGEGDPTFEAHWKVLVDLYPMLNEAINACRK